MQKYKFNIRVTAESVGVQPSTSAVYSCPVCDGNADQCTFCGGTGLVTAEKLSTYEPETLK